MGSYLYIYSEKFKKKERKKERKEKRGRWGGKERRQEGTLFSLAMYSFLILSFPSYVFFHTPLMLSKFPLLIRTSMILCESLSHVRLCDPTDYSPPGLVWGLALLFAAPVVPFRTPWCWVLGLLKSLGWLSITAHFLLWRPWYTSLVKSWK